MCHSVYAGSVRKFSEVSLREMGKTQSKAAENSGTVVNSVAVEVHQAELVDIELFAVLYILVAIHIANLL